MLNKCSENTDMLNTCDQNVYPIWWTISFELLSLMLFDIFVLNAVDQRT